MSACHVCVARCVCIQSKHGFKQLGHGGALICDVLYVKVQQVAQGLCAGAWGGGVLMVTIVYV